MPTPCESWPRRLASTRLAATCAASPLGRAGGGDDRRATAAVSASARNVKVSVMAGGGECGRAKRNKRAGIRLCVLSAAGWWHSQGSSIVDPRKAAITAQAPRRRPPRLRLRRACVRSRRHPGTTPDLQQRTADGRMLLTDRPSAAAPDRAHLAGRARGSGRGAPARRSTSRPRPTWWPSASSAASIAQAHGRRRVRAHAPGPRSTRDRSTARLRRRRLRSAAASCLFAPNRLRSAAPPPLRRPHRPAAAAARRRLARARRPQSTSTRAEVVDVGEGRAR